ncbi:MAG: aspartate aminotransferase family protein [Nisaea sp.]|jgi:beta-alanine--pyruvate transaminase|nr:aspartate aminotransferase family protein [Nisaea sp.]MEC7972401.1 aspartate aminotransferase family protein [Pseudomonadota bacterium]
MSITDVNVPNDLDSLWMPFTDNRNFKKQPKLFSEAEGMYYYTPDGRKVLDGTSGLWCVNAGHRRKPIIEAVSKQVEKLDYAPGFQVGHPLSFEFASRLVGMVNEYSHVMFTNSGSESVDTALKIALAYQRNIGQGNRTRFVGRERGYHGVGFGGISVGGISPNRKMFGNMLTGIDHLKHTHNLEHNAFIKGQPEWGAHLADDLESIVALHDASNIAAVIVEPVAGSTGVLIPPKGYLQRLREICTKHGILLIFDEVITGFGRLGDSFANEYFGVKPDIFTTAKGITNATVPMGAVFVRDGIYDSFMEAAPEGAIEFFHGYTYSGHPLACAAGLATLEVYREEDLFARAAELAPYFQEAVHSLADCSNVIDVRNLGLMGAIELESIVDKPTVRAMEAFQKAFEAGLLVRTTGDTIALSPPLIVERKHIDFIAETVRDVLKTVH